MSATRGVLVAVAAIAIAILGLPAPALAHDDVGELELLVSEQTPSRTEPGAIDLRIEALLTFQNDGHPADGAATVSFVADAADGGASAGPVIAEPTDSPGVFAGTLVLPSSGTWMLRVSALTPLATLTASIEVAPLPTPAPVASTSTAPSPEPTTRTASPAPTPSEETRGDDAFTAAWLVAAGAVAAVVAIIGVVLVRRRSGPSV